MSWIHLLNCQINFEYAHASGKVYTVVSTQIPPQACLADTCLTLSQFAKNFTNYIASNTTLIITGENHYLDTGILASNVVSFTMQSAISASHNSVPAIICNKSANFSFTKVGNLHINGLIFKKCDGNRFESINQIKIEYSTFLDSKSPLAIINSNASMVGTRFFSNLGNYIRNFKQLLEHPNQILTASNSAGGALLTSDSNVSIDNCSFIGNNACFGGAICSECGSCVTISNSNFSHNYAQDCVSGYCAGGALLIDDQSIALINNSVFHNNTAEFDGAMIVAFSSIVLISQSDISNNTASRYGGAVAASHNSSIMFDFIYMHDNRAKIGGGAMYLHESNAMLNNCKILNNEVKGDGGVIYEAYDSTVKVSNSTVSNNKALRRGGAVYGRNNSHVDFSNCNVVSNSAEYGGLIQLDIKSTLHIISSVLTGNKALNKGGIAHATNESMITIKYSNLTDNWAGGYGGAVRVEIHGILNISHCNLNDNRADYGGALEANTRSITNIALCNFNRNRATNSAAAVHVYDSSKATIKRSSFNRNVANDSGAAVYGRINCNISISDSTIYNSTTGFSGGGVYIGHDSNIYIENCTFLNNTADFGGAILVFVSTCVTIINSSFDQNRAAIEGGALHIYKKSSMRVFNSHFSSNKAGSGGVSHALLDCELTFENSSFLSNSADFGGVMGLLEGSVATIIRDMFTNNTAQSGGVLYVHRSRVVVKMGAKFYLNNATLFGGVIHATDNSTINISKTLFFDNIADNGGVLSLLVNSTGLVKHSDFIKNQASDSGGVIYSNKARLCISDSRFNSSSAFMRGGVVAASSVSILYIKGSNFSHSIANMGATLAVAENSTLSFTSQWDISIANPEIPTDGNDKTLIKNSKALWFGGGIYLGDSCLHTGIETTVTIMFNEAGSFGGGIHAVNSSIVVNHIIHFVSNKATSGGGLSLRNSKVNNVKSEAAVTTMNFVSNQADKGGALYNSDKDIADVCSGESSNSGCFFQNVSNAFVINFNKNQAKYGDNLFGGLLDRCSGASSTDLKHGIVHFINISNITTTLQSVTSKPIQVCFCENGNLNCSIRSRTIQIKHKSTMILQVAAIDQASHTVSATIFLNQTLGNDFMSIMENQATHAEVINASCSNISFHITAPPSPILYEATIFADGPCGDKGISKLTVNIDVVPCTCAPGFKIDNNNNNECKCDCDQQLLEYGYIKGCDLMTHSVERKGVFWITVTDSNFSYLFFPYCPMGYCQSPDKLILVNLGQTNGSDTQCANNHTGLLCGKCQQHYSLSLGSFKCIQCHKKWFGQLIGTTIAALFAGIFLVAIILVLNLTVAVGTLNSVIFYANIVYSNMILTQSQFSSVFISWLNLDIGFDVCLYEGMDAYTKTWLQLAFPTYIIFLVVAIIWISSHSSTFSNLIGKGNPIATLATLILMSYSKFLQTIIITFSFVKSNGNIKPTRRWLYDASIVYFGWKHALLFFTAVLILFVGLFYTILLFSWQWFLHCPRSKVFNWARNQRLRSFIDTYHTPHTAKHRYLDWSASAS